MNKNNFILFQVVMFLFPLLNSYKVSNHNNCHILKVIDGDTVIVKLKNFTKVKSRLGYIDALEKQQGPEHKLAVRFLEKYLHKNCTCKIIGKGFYKRFIMEIYFNNVSLNFLLLKYGFVFLYPQSSFEDLEHKRNYKNAFKKAFLENQGIFKMLLKEEKILTPWGYRRQKKIKLK